MTNFKLHKEFGEIKIFNYDRFEDNRGYFSEIYVKDMVCEHLANFQIEQINFSMTNKNVARGLHLQIDPPMGKMMRLVKGKAILFAFDCRRTNSEIKKIHYFEVNKDSNTIIWAPYYFARGFISLEDETLIEYFCTSKYNKDGEYAIKIFDQDLDQPYRDNYKLSEKDMNAMSVKDWFSLNIDL